MENIFLLKWDYLRRELPLFCLCVTVLNILYWSSNVGCSTIPVTFFSSIFKCRVK